MNTIENYDSHLFVFAHPDDEVYTCGLMNRLVLAEGAVADKAVTAVFITSGDAGGNASGRSAELYDSMTNIGVSDVVTLAFPEKSLLSSFPAVLKSLGEIIDDRKPDCVVGMDYEGGHEGHDSASFLTAKVAGELALPHYVFPVYHAEGGQRVAADFVPGRKATDRIELTEEEIDLKVMVLEDHQSQIGHFLQLQRRDPTYFSRLLEREVYRQITEPIPFTERPAPEVGYESHRNGFKFEDFIRAANTVT